MQKKYNIDMNPTAYRDITRYSNKDWNIEAFDIQRSMIKNQDYNGLDIQGHSIYFLYGEDENEKLRVYVGRSSNTTKAIPVFTRLWQHKISSTEYYRDMWNKVIAIKFQDLSFDDMRHLENYFFKAIKEDIKLNKDEPDTDRYKYEQIQHKVEYIKEYVTYILREDIFKSEKKQEAETDVQLSFSEAELNNQGKRLVDKDDEVITEIQTPLEVVNEMLDLLPKYVWGPETKFLDMTCKSGEYLKCIFNRLMISDLYKGTPYERAIARALYITNNQLYGIALTQKSFENTKKNLIGTSNIINFSKKPVGLEYVMTWFNTISRETLRIEKLKQNENSKAFQKATVALENAKADLSRIGITEKTFEEYLQKLFGDKNMRFDVIIGNPPYQQDTKSIYNEFINSAISLNADNIVMIVKNNWLVSDTLKMTRDNMINTGLTEIINYSETGETFNKVGAAVAVFMMQKGYAGETHYKEIKRQKVIADYVTNLKGAKVIASNEIEQQIINRFSAIRTNGDFSIRTYPSEPFRITTNGKVGRGENAYKLDEYDTKSSEHNIAVIYMDEVKKPHCKYISIDSVPSRVELVPKYKILCGRILTRDNNVINNIRLANPNTVCTSSWGMLFTSDSKDEARAAEKYIKTKLFRCLVRCLAEDGLIAISAYRFSLIPDQDFTATSDIDWSQPISNIDQQLYKKYNLSEEEVAYIESTIKSLDTTVEASPTMRFTLQEAEANLINRRIQNEEF